MVNWSNITTFEQMLSSANDTGPFWTMMLFMMWAVLFITFLPFGTMTALMGGSFVVFFIGLFLVYMGLVAWYWVLALFCLVVLAILWNTLHGKKDS